MARPRGMGLRKKFMLVLAGVTAGVLILQAVSMSLTSNRFLVAIKRHSGIEIARFAAQVGIAVDSQLQEQLRSNSPSDHNDLTDAAGVRLEARLASAITWQQGLEEVSDVYAVRFYNAGDFLTGRGWGQPDEGARVGERYTDLLIAKTGRVIRLPDNIEVFEAEALVDTKRKPIYRFAIGLGEGYGSEAKVRVDVARDSVLRVSRNLNMIIAGAVLVSLLVVVLVANWLAGNITRPVDLLLKDMQMVARGDLDHQTKPRSDDEIGVLAIEFNKMTQNLALAQSALVEQEKAEYELSLAREVQRQLLPSEAPQISGFDCMSFYQGAKAVSGDYFDFIPLGNGLIGFIVADVSGKGIPGSMVMAVTRTIVRLVANKHQNNAADTLRETNRLIAKQIKRGMFVTAFYAILDPATGIVTYSSAGHNPIVVYRHATKSYELASTKGIALGFNEGPIFDKTVQEDRLQLAAGDLIVLYTDGFPEAMNESNEEFGDEKFYQLVADHGEQPSRTLVPALVQEIAKHRGAAEQSDDLTLIVVRRTA